MDIRLLLAIVTGVGVTGVACAPTRSTQACEDYGLDAAQVASMSSLEQLPPDSVVSALLTWAGGIPAGAVDSLKARNADVFYVFHYQPAILVTATVAVLRELLAWDSSIQLSLGAPTTLAVDGCP